MRQRCDAQNHNIQSIWLAERLERGLPGLDWACLLLATLDVALVHLVLASAIREAKSSSNVELGLGSERGRKGLENGVLSLV